MIIVNIETDAELASEVVRRAASASWVVGRAVWPAYADGLLAVCDRRIFGAYRILGHSTTRDGRVCFELEESSRLAFLIGRPAPIHWNGNAGLAQLVATESVVDLLGGGSDELTAARRRRLRAGAPPILEGAESRALASDRPRLAGEWAGAAGQLHPRGR